MSDYRVHFEVFEGPLDLLLHLVRKQEVDIYQINLTRIATDFVAYIEQMRELDLEVAGEFLVMAATLIYIKSRELLPVDKQVKSEVDDEGGEDPRWELIRRLVEYRKFKDAALTLQGKEGWREEVYERRPIRPDLSTTEVARPREAVSVFDLVHAVSAILKRSRARLDVNEINADPYTVSEKIESLLGLLTGRKRLRLGELFASAQTRSEIVVTFLALLELIRMRQVTCHQSEDFGEIDVEPREFEVPEEGVEEPALPPADIVPEAPIVTPDTPPDPNPLSTAADQSQNV